MEKGKNFAQNHGPHGFRKTSARIGHPVDDGLVDTINEEKLLPVVPSSGFTKTSYDYRFKYVIVGKSSVGKSALMIQFIEKVFRHCNKPAFDAEFGGRTIVLHGKQIRLQVWDTIGQERFNSVSRSYYRDAAAVFLVYDVTKRDTFKYLPWLLEEVRNNTSPYAAMTLVGNKIDLNEERQVAKSEGEAFAKKECLNFMEVSAKTGANVEDIFMRAADEIYEKILADEFDVNTKPGPFKLSRNHFNPKYAKRKKSCCSS